MRSMKGEDSLSTRTMTASFRHSDTYLAVSNKENGFQRAKAFWTAPFVPKYDEGLGTIPSLLHRHGVTSCCLHGRMFSELHDPNGKRQIPAICKGSGAGLAMKPMESVGVVRKDKVALSEFSSPNSKISCTPTIPATRQRISMQLPLEFADSNKSLAQID